jgi:predicted aspartyl protease
LKFAYVSPKLDALGPVVSVDISASNLLRSAMPSRREWPTIRALALVDTGATGTVFTPEVFERLGINPYDATEIRTAGHEKPVPASVFRADLSILSGDDKERIVLADCRLIEASLRGQHVHGLIGRDVLKNFVLEYHGPNSLFTLEHLPRPTEQK